MASLLVAVPLSNGMQLVLHQAQPHRPPTIAGPPSPSLTARFEPGPEPGTIVLQFSKPISQDAVAPVAAQLGMSILSGDPVAGRFVLALPQAQVVPGPNHTARIFFPDMASQSDIVAYFARNHLALIAWKRDPYGGRSAIVRLPTLAPRVIDARRGYFSVVLPVTDRQTVDGWAAASGVRVISYDPNTGEAVVQPIGWRPIRPALDSTALLLNKLIQQALTNHAASTTTTQTSAGTPSNASQSFQAVAQDGHVDLTWHAVTGAMSYQIFRVESGGQPVLVGTTTVTTFTDTGGRPGTSYTWKLVAVPAAGAQSVPPVTTAPTVWQASTSPPIITKITPSGTTLTGHVQLQLDARTGDGAGTVTWYLDGTAGSTSLGAATVQRVDGEPLQWTSSLSWDSTTVADGPYTLRAAVASGAGVSTTVSQQYRVQNAPTTGSSTTGTTTTGTTTTTTSPSPSPAIQPFQVAATDGHVALGWATVAGATAYRIYRVESGGQPALVGTTTATTFTDTGGRVGTMYTWQVVAVLPDGTQTIPPAGADATAWPASTSHPTISQVAPSGPLVAGTVQFEVDVRTGDGTGSVTFYLDSAAGSTTLGTAQARRLVGDPLAWTASLSWNSTAVADGNYTLRAVVSSGAGVTTTVTQPYRVDNSPPPAPTAFAAAGVPGGIALSWQQPAFADAARYQLFRDGGSQPIAQLPADARSYVDAQAGPGTHSYALVLLGKEGQTSAAVSASGTSQAGSPTTIIGVRLLTPSGAPLAADGLVTGRLLLEFEAVPLAAGIFEYSADSTAWFAVPVAATCEQGRCAADWNVGTLIAGHYVVRARSGATISASRSFTVAHPAPVQAPVNLAAVSAPRGVALHWSPPPAAVNAYSVWRQSDAADWQLLDRVVGSDYFDALPAGGTLAYRVRALDANGAEGEASQSASVRQATEVRPAQSAEPTQLATPDGLRAVWAPGGVTLSWYASSGAEGYVIERSWAVAGPFQPVGTTAATSYVDRAGGIGGLADYRIRARSDDAASAPSSHVSALLLPPAPVAQPPATVVAGSGLASPAPADVVLSAASAPLPAEAPVAVQPPTTSHTTPVVAPPASPVLAGRGASLVASGTATATLSAARVEVTSTAGPKSWRPMGVIPATSSFAGWTAIGSVSTAVLDAGTYLVRVVAVALNGDAVQTTGTATLQVTHSAPAPQAVQAQVVGNGVVVTWSAPVSSTPMTLSLIHI